MKILLTPQESETFFHNSLCNGLGYVEGYGLELTFKDSHYKAARKKLGSPCYEDVLLQILKDGKPLKMIDHECDGEYTREITLKDVHEKVQTTDASWLLQMENGEDDATTADCILQTVFFGDIIFG
jgi:hypothetical protein